MHYNARIGWVGGAPPEAGNFLATLLLSALWLLKGLIVKISSYVCGEWREGAGDGDPILDPVTGDELARVTSQGIDSDAALQYARSTGGEALRRLSYQERAELLGKVGDVLTANRGEYFRISLLNLGAGEADASFDVDGAIYTIKYYAKIGKALGAAKMLREGAQIPLSKTGVFSGQHFLTPLHGVAVFINAFNFPAWGFCEKAAAALLSGVPVLVKPASPTAWLTQKMVEDIAKAGILPAGALSIICGSARDLLDNVREGDVVSFTGSAETAARIRSNTAVVRHSVRTNIEADSINSTTLGPDVTPGSEIAELFAKEVVREMTLKAGQKCTAIRRIFVPRDNMKQLGELLVKRLAAIKVGNPRNAEVKMGPVVNKAQQTVCLEGIRQLKKECSVLFGDIAFQPLDADPVHSTFVPLTLLACENGREATHVHDTEVFGPVATLISYDSLDDLISMIRRGAGSLVTSVFSSDAAFLESFILRTGDLHGRILAVDAAVGAQHTGHGNVVPSCIHGGPGRAGGGEELGGLRGLQLYHRRFVVQGPATLLGNLAGNCGDGNSLST
jgi:3,4-dehydroadipyl-CoA semialdehyde dehydrogenase